LLSFSQKPLYSRFNKINLLGFGCENRGEENNLVTTEVCRNVIGIIGKYLDPISAQFFVEKYCDMIKRTTDEFQHSDVPKFIIYLANERDNLARINDNQFEKLLKDLVEFSNLDFEQIQRHGNDPDDDDEIVFI
jgi:hypothetical protein